MRLAASAAVSPTKKVRPSLVYAKSELTVDIRERIRVDKERLEVEWIEREEEAATFAKEEKAKMRDDAKVKHPNAVAKGRAKAFARSAGGVFLEKREYESLLARIKQLELTLQQSSQPTDRASNEPPGSLSTGKVSQAPHEAAPEGVAAEAAVSPVTNRTSSTAIEPSSETGERLHTMHAARRGGLGSAALPEEPQTIW